MTTLDYILLSLNKRLYLKKAWLISVLGILLHEHHTYVYEDIGLVFKDKKLYTNLTEELTEIIDFTPNKPLCDIHLNFIVKAGALKCIKEDVKTTYGILLLNALMIEYPYDGDVEYCNRELNGKVFNGIAYKHLVDTRNVDPMHLKFENAIGETMALSQVSIPSMSRKSVIPNPAVVKIKAELLEKYKDKLSDPAIVSLIQNELAEKVDREYLKGDISEGFFITSKQRNVARLKLYGMVGAEPDIYDETKMTLMTRSLNEGWAVEDLPMLINASRRGSYNRGQETALAGVDVKNTSRIFQNYDVTDEDCGSTMGESVRINNMNYTAFVGNYLLKGNSPLTEDVLKSKIGTWVSIRSPLNCRTAATSFCKKCMGDIVSNSGVGLTAQANTLTSSFLSLFMSLVHAVQLSTQEYFIEDRIT